MKSEALAIFCLPKAVPEPAVVEQEETAELYNCSARFQCAKKILIQSDLRALIGKDEIPPDIKLQWNKHKAAIYALLKEIEEEAVRHTKKREIPAVPPPQLQQRVYYHSSTGEEMKIGVIIRAIHNNININNDIA